MRATHDIEHMESVGVLLFVHFDIWTLVLEGEKGEWKVWKLSMRKVLTFHFISDMAGPPFVQQPDPHTIMRCHAHGGNCVNVRGCETLHSREMESISIQRSRGLL